MALLGGAFKAAAVGVIAAGLSIAPGDASIDSRDKIEQQKPGAMDVVMDRLMGGLKYEPAAPSAPTNTIVTDTRQTSAPDAKGSFNNAVVASPVLGQKIADVTAALDTKPDTNKLRADTAPVATADVGKIDRDSAARGKVADKAMAAVNTLKDAAQTGGKPSMSGFAANSFAGAAVGAIATSMGAPPRMVAAAQMAFDATQAVAANGAGTYGATTPSTLSGSFNSREKGARQPSGYMASVSAPQPVQQAQAAKPVEIAGRDDLYGRATMTGDSLTGVASLKIGGKDLDQLQRNIGAMTRDSRETRQTMDVIAMNGFKVDLGEAAARIGNGGLSARQVDPLVAANAPVTIRPLAPRPGMSMA